MIFCALLSMMTPSFAIFLEPTSAHKTEYSRNSWFTWHMSSSNQGHVTSSAAGLISVSRHRNGGQQVRRKKKTPSATWNQKPPDATTQKSRNGYRSAETGSSYIFFFQVALQITSCQSFLGCSFHRNRLICTLQHLLSTTNGRSWTNFVDNNQRANTVAFSFFRLLLH